MHNIRRRNAGKPPSLTKTKENKKKIEKIDTFPRTKEDALKREYKFWSTQPVTKLTEHIGKNGIIDKDINLNPETEPITLADGYDWVQLNINNDDDLSKITEFINQYYIEDISGQFRLHYSSEFLRWYFTKPFESKTDTALCLGVVVKETGLLVGFISSILSKNQIYSGKLKTSEVNFLCVHPKLRDKRLSPLLIKELSRRVKLQSVEFEGLKQMIYTSNKYLPTPFASAKYYHRPIDMDALIETNFTIIPKNLTILDIKKQLLLPKNMAQTYMKLNETHITGAMNVLNEYFEKFTCHPLFDEDEFKHVFLNNNIVSSYVVMKDDNIVDFVSFYKLPSKILESSINQKYPFLNIGYLYYYSSNSENLYNIINNIVIAAKNEGMHVFNALDIMENSLILKDLKFQEGSGKLNYYLGNYNCMEMTSTQIAKILF